MFYKYTLLIFIMGISLSSFAQVGIGTTNPDASAMLQIESSNKGVLITKVHLSSTSDSSTITSPATGLLIYNTSSAGTGASAVAPGFYFYNGSKWERLLNTGNVISNTASITANTRAIDNLTDNDTTYTAGTGLTLSDTEFSIESNVVTSTYTGDLALTGDITQTGNISTTGTISATAFAGDGSGLTGISTGVNSSTFKDEYLNVVIGTEMKNLNSGKIYRTRILDGTVYIDGYDGYANIAIGDSTLLFNTTGNYNIGLGFQALLKNTEGDNNIAIGEYALKSNIDGGDNIAIGEEALEDNTEGWDNIAIGEDVLRSNWRGDDNIAIGEDALEYNTTGDDNIAIGDDALRYNRTGEFNIAIGNDAMVRIDEGDNNVSVGVDALDRLESGNYNTALGFEAGGYNEDSENRISYAEGITLLGALTNSTDSDISNSTAIGYGAVVTASNNIQLGNTDVNYVITSGTVSAAAFVGDGSGLTNIEIPNSSITSSKIASGSVTKNKLDDDSVGSSKIIDGSVTTSKLDDDSVGSSKIIDGSITSSKLANDSVTNSKIIDGSVTTSKLADGSVTYDKLSNTNDNVALGNRALESNTTGTDNIALGSYALASNTEGGDSVAIGYQALKNNTTGINNVAIGTNALTSNTLGIDNLAIGSKALEFNTTGRYNIALGNNTLLYNTYGWGNNAIGLNALTYNTTGVYNIAIGTRALERNTTGDRNISIGESALQNNNGNHNIAIGEDALKANTIGAYNTGIGTQAGFGATSGIKLTEGSGNTLFGAYTDVGSETLSNSTAIGYEAIVTASNTIQLGNTDVTHVVTSGTVSASAFVGDGSGLTGVTGISPFSTTLNVTTNSNGDLSRDDFVFGSASLENVSGSDDDKRFFFDKSKGAFRAGYSDGNEWNDVNVSEYSIGLGYNVKSSGLNGSVSMGNQTNASGNYGATAIGFNAIAVGHYGATAIGYGVSAKNYSEVVVGANNIRPSNTSRGSWRNTDPIFTVGNGKDESNRSNALQILKSGNTRFYGSLQIDGSAIGVSFISTSDQRLKTDIEDIKAASAQLAQLQPKKYKKKSSIESEEYTMEEMGFLAQDIQKLFPYLVREGNDPDKLLSLDYNSFIALLVKGFQEQQTELKEMKENQARMQAQLDNILGQLE